MYQKIDKIQDVQSAIKDESLVAFDVDLTLLVPDHQIGMPQWSYTRIEHYLKEGHNSHTAFRMAVVDLLAVYNLVKFQPAEPHTARFLEALREKNVDIIGLTARGLELSHATHLHLRDNQMRFADRFEEQKERILKHPDLVRAISLDEGVIYTSGQHKGMALDAVLKSMEYPLRHLVFVDDEVRNLDKMHDFCSHHNWNCSLFLYTGAHPLVNDFDLQVANKRWSWLKSQLQKDHDPLSLEGHATVTLEGKARVL
ncbi:MAG: DUF2608 domain-containing protein [Oligoflexales bacterium]